MRRVLAVLRARWRLALAVVLALPLLAALLLLAISQHRLGADYSQVRATLPDSLAGDAVRGDYLARTRGCRDCHGDDLGGKVMADDLPMLRLVAPNLTTGRGGSAAVADAAAFDLALRHGIGPDERALIAMPSNAFAGISDEEVADLRAFMLSVPAVDRELADTRFGLVGRMLFGAGVLGELPAERIDHDRAPPAQAPALQASVEYGAYVAQGCKGCHGPEFAGGVRHGPPDFPRSANLTPSASGLAGWNLADFERALRDGLRPDGSTIDARAMPISATRALEPVELEALWVYLSQLPARDATE